MLDTTIIRAQYPFLQGETRIRVENPTGGKRTFLDNTASTQVPRAVLERIVEASMGYANVHRGAYDASLQTTEDFERAYNIAANLVNARSWREIIFGRNTSEMMNLVMRATEPDFNDGDNIVVTGLEHNSNYVPWHALQQEMARCGKKVEVRIVPFDHKTGAVDIKELRRMVDARTKIVSATGASNFLGVRPDVRTIGEIAHGNGYRQPSGMKGAYFVVDGAQLVPGTPVDVQAIGCDFLAWSFHKMTLPLGVGGLYAKQEVIEPLRPFLFGGDMIIDVKPGEVQYQQLPWRYTAGTPNVLGTIGTGFGITYLLNAALGNLGPENEAIGRCIETEALMNTPRGDFEIKYVVPEELADIFSSYMERYSEVLATLRNPVQRMEKAQDVVRKGMAAIQQHEEDLTQRALDGLGRIPHVTIYGPRDARQRAGLVAFNIDGMDHQNVAFELNKRNVEVRNGTHCASLAHHYMGLAGSVRMSFYIYNTTDEVDAGVAAVREIVGAGRA